MNDPSPDGCFSVLDVSMPSHTFLSPPDVQTFHDEMLPQSVLWHLNELRNNEQLCDVELEADGSTVLAHRVVLAASIPYFRAMFCCQMRESTQRTIVMNDISFVALRLLVDYAYTAEVMISGENVQQLLFAASILQVDSVCAACQRFLSDYLTTANCLSIRQFAEQHNCGNLLSSTDNFAVEHFAELRKLPEFRHIPFTHLRDLIKRSDLKVNSEQEVFDTVVEWIGEDVEERETHLPELFALVRLCQLKASYLKEVVLRNPLIRSNRTCMEYVTDATIEIITEMKLGPKADEACTLLNEETGGQYAANNKSGEGSTSQQVSSTSDSLALRPLSPAGSRVRPRKSIAGVIFCVGGRGTAGDPFRTVEAYDWRKNRWFPIAEMTAQRRHVGVVSAHSKLYAIGGHDGSNHLATAEVYDPVVNQWQTLAPMRTCRRGIAVGAIEGAIYAVGGLDDAACFQTVERYDIESNVWTHVAKMNVQRGGVGVAALGKYLFAVGGNDGTSSLDSCERYDPHLDKWKLVARMMNRRAGAGVTVLDGFLYAVGGFDDNAPLNTCERYDPGEDQWTQLANMSCARGGVGVASMGGLVYAIGGHDGCRYLNSVEAYDPATNQWRPVAHIHECRAGAGVAWADCRVDDLLRPRGRAAQDSGCAPYAGKSPCV